MNDRGLAVGSGHGGDRPGLSAIEAGGKTCQPSVRIWIDEDRYALARGWCERERFGIVGQDCDGAVRHGSAAELYGDGTSGRNGDRPPTEPRNIDGRILDVPEFSPDD